MGVVTNIEVRIKCLTKDMKSIKEQFPNYCQSRILAAKKRDIHKGPRLRSTSEFVAIGKWTFIFAFNIIGI